MTTRFQPPTPIQESRVISPRIDVNKMVNTGQFLSSETLKNIRLKMSSQLQTTLEIDQLVNILFEELRQVVELHGIHYRLDSPVFRCTVGGIKKHKITYRLTTGKQEYGELTFSRSRRFRDEELFALESLMDLFIYPLRNAIRFQEVLSLSLTDQLTGAGNRNAMHQTMIREMERAKRHDQAFSVIVLDIDNFKMINDRYGHGVGDQVLKKVSKDIELTIRTSDAYFRFGGEEFLIVLPQTDVTSAELLAERIRCIIATHMGYDLVHGGVTVSMGLAGLKGDMSSDEIINQADQALYCAKRKGKNQVVTAVIEQPGDNDSDDSERQYA